MCRCAICSRVCTAATTGAKTGTLGAAFHNAYAMALALRFTSAMSSIRNRDRLSVVRHWAKSVGVTIRKRTGVLDIVAIDWPTEFPDAVTRGRQVTWQR